MRPPPFMQSGLLPVRHGFFTREGGVSAVPYDALNGGTGTQDAPDAVRENRQRIAAMFGLGGGRLAGLDQVHGAGVRLLHHVRDVPDIGACSPAAFLPEGDAMVTDCPDIVLGIATADCAPVLFSSAEGRIVGAAHAGWRGAVAGVLEATVSRMRQLGGEEIRAAVGPCIGPASYEVGEDMRAAVLTAHPAASSRFLPAGRGGHYRFDLPGFCLSLLAAQGVQAEWTGHDTLVESRFFSHRRASLTGDARTGRQIAAIRPVPA